MSGGVSMVRPARGENRFYVSPAMRKNQHQRKHGSDRSGSSSFYCSVSGRAESTGTSTSTSATGSESSDNSSKLSNLERFLDHTAPVVPAHFLPKTSISHPFFVLGDLWESFKEWSAYGAGVPVLLNGTETVVQYYVPYLSGIQLYRDPSRTSPRLRPGEDSDADSSRETSSDSGSDFGSEIGANNGSHQPLNQQNFTAACFWDPSKLSLQNTGDSSSDDSEISNLQGQLIFEYFEHASPFTREPLADKILALASHFPDLKSCRSCDLSRASWMSVAWYPIYRIPMGPTLQNLDACFLTFHSLSTPFQTGQNAARIHDGSSGARDVCYGDVPSKMHLPTFGLAPYKFKVSFWNSNGVYKCQKVDDLLWTADNWLRSLQVDHPDYRFFISHGSNWS